eukprot:365254-Chlamydomonas_euryale.AAC.7
MHVISLCKWLNWSSVLLPSQLCTDLLAVLARPRPRPPPLRMRWPPRPPPLALGVSVAAAAMPAALLFASCPIQPWWPPAAASGCSCDNCAASSGTHACDGLSAGRGIASPALDCCPPNGVSSFGATAVSVNLLLTAFLAYM